MADPPGAIGTDMALVLAAIEAAASDDGVIVLMDLGSAVMSAEMAAEMVDGTEVLLCEAPLVEGAVAAAARARTGAPLAEVAAEARAAIGMKAAQLGVETAAPAAAAARISPTPRSSASRSRTSSVSTPARPRASSRPPSRFDATVTVADETTGRGPADARSLSALITLGAHQGHEILVRAAGPEASQALAALRELAGRRLRRRERRRTRRRRRAAPPPAHDRLQPARSSGVPRRVGHRDRPRPPIKGVRPPYVRRKGSDPSGGVVAARGGAGRGAGGHRGRPRRRSRRRSARPRRGSSTRTCCCSTTRRCSGRPRRRSTGARARAAAWREAAQCDGGGVSRARRPVPAGAGGRRRGRRWPRAAPSHRRERGADDLRGRASSSCATSRPATPRRSTASSCRGWPWRAAARPRTPRSSPARSASRRWSVSARR